MRWLAGTSGFSYKEWKGPFYPPDISPSAMLAFYATRLPAVEINNTFYRMPRAEVLANWRDAVPASFRFAIKASRRITHQAKLADCADAVGYLAAGLETLGDKLGCVLFQLPPYVRKDVALLDAFLANWPTAFPAAVEFRHASWFDAATTATLAKHGAALCVSEDGKLTLPELRATTDWLYLRLRKPSYEESELAAWSARAATAGAKRGYAFFKHEDAGAGPRLATRFLKLAGAD